MLLYSWVDTDHFFSYTQFLKENIGGDKVLKFIIFLFSVLGIEPRASCILATSSVTKLYPQPFL